MLALALVGCNRSVENSPVEAAKSTNSTASAASDVAGHEAVKTNLESPIIGIETSVGPIKIRLDGVHAPGTVRNFLNYVNDKFYDNTLVHFVDSGKMILAGGYSIEKRLKPTGTPIRSEAHNGLKNGRGTIAMTRDPSLIDSATSQFFINLADAPQRDHTGDSADQYGYCVFGEVIEGLETAQKISQSPTKDLGGDLAQTPDPPVVIKSVRVVR